MGNESSNKECKQDFIRRATLIHNGKYDYSKTEYFNTHQKVCIICKQHGEFYQTPSNHLAKHGCPKCANGVLTTEIFITKSIEKYGNKYNYSNVKYINNNTPITIICPIHGSFEQKPKKHLDGLGCIKCKNSKTTEQFIAECREKHGDKYDYSKTIYLNWKLKVCIICPIHGEFYQLPSSHLNGNGCSKCGDKQVSNKLRHNNDKFIFKANNVHGDKYDYSMVEYINKNTPITIICKLHGAFQQTPEVHLKKCGCKGCNKITTDEYIKKVINVRGYKYDYSKVNYLGGKEKVCIICPEHGEFWQSPSSHLRGSGCPECAGKNNLSEKKMLKIIRDNFIKYNITYQFKACWLKNQSIDIYLNDYDIAVEYHGKQHFVYDNCWGGINGFLTVRERDVRKYNLCIENNVNLLYFTYENPKYIIDYFDKVYTNEDELINKIKELIKIKHNEKSNKSDTYG